MDPPLAPSVLQPACRAPDPEAAAAPAPQRPRSGGGLTIIDSRARRPSPLYSSPEVLDPLTTLVAALAELDGRPLLVVTGAGVSLASGIPTFRGDDAGAIWKQDLTELGTERYFRADPVEAWRWYLTRFDSVRSAGPNPAHRAIAALERWQVEATGDFLLVTQNVDLLHERAGSRRLVKVHGSADGLRCVRAGCRHGAPNGSLPRDDFDFTRFLEAPARDRLPRCPACDELLRPHVLFFDEHYQGHRDYQFERVVAAAEQAALVLFVGTSFSVGVTDLLVGTALQRRVPTFAVEPGRELPFRAPGVTFLRSTAEVLLPAVCDALGAPIP
jgi:NAD-dependent deacetylase